ncbi:hypothetical protein HaLaN_00087, partial [Haematococcus lacustris]
MRNPVAFGGNTPPVWGLKSSRLRPNELQLLMPSCYSKARSSYIALTISSRWHYYSGTRCRTTLWVIILPSLKTKQPVYSLTPWPLMSRLVSSGQVRPCLTNICGPACVVDMSAWWAPGSRSCAHAHCTDQAAAATGRWCPAQGQVSSFVSYRVAPAE